MNPQTDAIDVLRAKLTLETAQISWAELLKFFAAGTVVAVSDRLDLVEVALALNQDNANQLSLWMQAGQVSKVSDEQAKAWLEQDALLWSVVVKPWILVQRKNSDLH